MPVYGHLEQFRDGQDWGKYIAVLKNYLGANDITSADKRRQILLSTVGLETYELICTLVAPDTPESKTFDELVEVVQKHVKPPPSKIVARFKFYTLSRTEGESISSLVVKLRQTAQDCKFTNLNEHLRDRFIVSVGDKKIQTKLLAMSDDVTFAEALKVALAMESAAQNADDIQAAASSSVSSRSAVAVVSEHPTAPRGPCYSCGGDHYRRQCKFKSAVCHACGKSGHISKVCHSTRSEKLVTGAATRRKTSNKKRTFSSANIVNNQGNAKGSDSEDSENSESVCYTIGSVEKLDKSTLEVPLHIQSQSVTMLVDTGAAVSIISRSTYKKHFPNLPLKEFKSKLTTYTGEAIKVLGCAEVDVQYCDQQARLPLVVVEGDGPSLFGRNWLKHIRLNWLRIGSIHHTSIKDVIISYPEVFKCDVSKFTGPPVKLHIDPAAHPRFFKARPVPYAIKRKVQEAIEENVRQDLWEPIEHSDWATPIVPIVKRDGSVRLCGDYKITVNKVCRVDPYPLPKVEDIFAELQGGQEFTKIDLHSAYSQIPIHTESQDYLTVNTHLGLFRVKRLAFGVNASVGIFQRLMNSVLKGLKGVCVYLDDILVTGRNRAEHLSNVRLVLERLKHAGLTVNEKKCSFLKPSVEYLGHKISAEGLHPTTEKMRAVMEAPTPTCKSELRSFLGLINYYAKFLPNLSSTLSPLYRLTKKDVTWSWDQEAKTAFVNAKELFCKSRVLVHYDPDKPLFLECDASSRGIGAVLSHRFADGTLRPVAFASRTLSSAEVNYSQIDREGLALVFGVTRFRQYVYGRRFTLITDHKPLMHLFGRNVSVPAMGSPRVRRWALILSAYDYDIQYKKGSDIPCADAMSRLPLPDLPCKAHTPEELVLVTNLMNSEPLVSVDVLRSGTRRETNLSQVLHWVRWGWPDKDPGGVFSPYFSRRREISVLEGCLTWGSRVIIPERSRDAVLCLLHDTHIGGTRMKATARSYVWWPNIDKDIENTVRTCLECDRLQPEPPVAELRPWEWPTVPWSRIHIDHAGPFMGKLFLIVIDAHSKWLEVKRISNSSTAVTVDALNSIFATHGLPVTLVSDNGTAFTSEEFKNYCKLSGIKHVTSAPRHPSTNGLAEKAVQIFKNCIKKMDQSLHWNARINKFLFKYRNTPHSTTQETPARLLLNREVRTPLSMIQSDLSSRVQKKQMDQCISHDKRAVSRYFVEGDKVYTHYGGMKVTWIPGIVQSITGPLSYLIELQDGRVVRRHVDHLRARHAGGDEAVPVEFEPVLQDLGEQPKTSTGDQPLTSPKLFPASPKSQTAFSPSSVPVSNGEATETSAEPAVAAEPVPEGPRRSGRIRHAPDRLGY